MTTLFCRRLPLAGSLRTIRWSSDSLWKDLESPKTVTSFVKSSNSSNSFRGLGIAKPICDALNTSLNITQPNAVQQKAIPRLSDGHDVMIQAETGSGKTLAFLLPLLQKSDHICSTVIVVPTRELAVQTLRVINTLFPPHSTGDFAVALVSGVDAPVTARDIRSLAPRCVVATPKRLVELMNSTPDLFAAVRHFVLDEVDRLLPPSAMENTRSSKYHHPRPALLAVTMLKEEILKHRQRSLQLVAVSATLTHSMRAVLLDLGFSETSRLVYMQDGIGVPPAVRHQYAMYHDPHHNKAALLTQIFNSLGAKQALVFMHDGAPLTDFVRLLKQKGVLAEALYAHQGNPDSMESYEAFCKDFERGDIQMVVANEATVRGLDYPFLEHVILLEVPPTPTAYIHAAGRSSRNGSPGTVTTLVCCSETVTKPMTKLSHIFRRLDIGAVKVVPEPFGDEITSYDPWDREGGITLDGTNAHHKQPDAASSDGSMTEGGPKEARKSRSDDDNDDDYAFQVPFEKDDAAERELLKSKHAVPVLTDSSDEMPYDVTQLGKQEFEKDDMEVLLEEQQKKRARNARKAKDRR